MASASPSPGRTTTSPTVEANSAVKLRSRVSVKIRVPLTNATPSTIANVLISSRSLRPSRLLSAALIMRRGHPGHDLEHLLLAGLAHLVDDPAVGEEHHPVGVRRRHRVVGHHHHGLPVVVDAAPQQLEHLGAGAGVEVAGRLVGEHHPRPADQRTRHRHPLLLTAGELVGLVGEPVAEAHGRDHRVVPLAVGAAARDREGQGDVLGGGERRHQVVGLEHEADLVAAQRGELAVVHPAEVVLADHHDPGCRRCPGRRRRASASTCPTRSPP